MKESSIVRAVAKATNESVREIRRRGFSLLDLSQLVFDPEPDLRPPMILDWDEVESRRREHYGPWWARPSAA